MVKYEKLIKFTMKTQTFGQHNFEFQQSHASVK